MSTYGGWRREKGYWIKESLISLQALEVRRRRHDSQLIMGIEEDCLSRSKVQDWWIYYGTHQAFRISWNIWTDKTGYLWFNSGWS